MMASMMNPIQKAVRLAVLSGLALACAGCVSPSAPGRADATWRITPFFEAGETAGGGSLFAVRPLFARETGIGGEPERAETDVLWPVGSFRRLHQARRWRFFPAFGEDADVADPLSRWNFWLLPFYFQGRTHEGEDYCALFPIYGEVRDILTLDYARFELFPLHAAFERNGVDGETWLWPIYRRRKGAQVDHLSLFPFYGRNDHSGSEEWTRRYICWPFWSDFEMRGPRAEGSGFIFFPFYGEIDLDRQQTRMVLPPFFSHTVGCDGYRRLDAPWPFIQFEDSPRRHRRSLWPFVGWTDVDDGAIRRWYALWPIFGGETAVLSSRKVARTYAAPIVYHETRTGVSPGKAGPAADGDASIAASRVWPLYSFRRSDNGESLLRVPELYPLGRHASVERAWAPLWSLYTARSHPEAGTRGEVLWGILSWGRNRTGGAHGELWPLVSFNRMPGHTAWSVLHGLAGRDADGAFRLLWFFRSGAPSARSP
jgi:hypothetical protein